MFQRADSTTPPPRHPGLCSSALFYYPTAPHRLPLCSSTLFRLPYPLAPLLCASALFYEPTPSPPLCSSTRFRLPHPLAPLCSSTLFLLAHPFASCLITSSPPRPILVQIHVPVPTPSPRAELRIHLTAPFMHRRVVSTTPTISPPPNPVSAQVRDTISTRDCLLTTRVTHPLAPFVFKSLGLTPTSAPLAPSLTDEPAVPFRV